MNCLWDWRLFSYYTACNKYLILCKDVFLAVKHLWKQELSALYVVDEWNVMMPGHIHKETIQYLQDCRFLEQCCRRFRSSGLWWSVECVVPSVSKCLQLHYHTVLQESTFLGLLDLGDEWIMILWNVSIYQLTRCKNPKDTNLELLFCSYMY